MSARSGTACRRPTRELELHLPVELLEALVAANLGLGGAELPFERVPEIWTLHQLPSSGLSRDRPSSSRWLRSLRRASCNVLYSAFQFALRRSASTSIGTPLRGERHEHAPLMRRQNTGESSFDSAREMSMKSVLDDPGPQRPSQRRRGGDAPGKQRFTGTLQRRTQVSAPRAVYSGASNYRENRCSARSCSLPWR